MKVYERKYCPNCGKMNTIDPARPHKKCKFCHAPLIFYPYPITTNIPKNVDPDNDNDNDTNNNDPDNDLIK